MSSNFYFALIMINMELIFIVIIKIMMNINIIFIEYHK